MLRSRERSNEFCSFVCAYRLLDVIVGQAAIDTTPPPVHKKMSISFPKNEVRIFHINSLTLSQIKQRSLRSFGDWTTILKRFRTNFLASTSYFESDAEMLMTSAPNQQLRALLMMNSGLNVEKSLINIQLAATHASFMSQRRSEGNVCYILV